MTNVGASLRRRLLRLGVMSESFKQIQRLLLTFSLVALLHGAAWLQPEVWSTTLTPFLRLSSLL